MQVNHRNFPACATLLTLCLLATTTAFAQDQEEIGGFGTPNYIPVSRGRTE